MPKRQDARQAAFSVLQAVGRGQLVAQALAQSPRLSGPDQALKTQLVYGVVRYQRYLDAWIDQLRRGPLDAQTRDILRVSLYQLRFLERVPAYAAVSSGVELAKAIHPRSAKLVNAVLRRATLMPPAHLSLGEEYSHPDWIVERWRARYPDRVVELLREDNQIPPLTLRVNLGRATREAVIDVLTRLPDVVSTPSRYLPEAIRVTGPLWLEDFAPFRDGVVQVQDESSMLVTWILDPQPGETVLDVAAGLGGKSFHVLERTRGQVRLTAVDRSVRRLQAFQQEAERLGYQRAVQTRAGLAQTVLPQLGQSFDRIVLDAPCSGLGVLRRRADARWRKRPDDLPRLAETQRELLAAAARVLAPDGVLVYSTCSVEPEETDAVIRFALDHLGLALERPTPYLPHADLAAYVVDDTVKLLPGDLGMDGFFIARLRPARADDRKVGRP